MAFLGLFGKKKEEIEVSLPEDDETTSKKSLQTERNRQNRERLKTEMELLRIKSEREKLEAIEELEELREERYLRRLERQARRQELESQILGDDDEEETPESPEMLLMQLLGKAFTKNNNPAPVQGIAPDGAGFSPEPQQVVAIPDEKILSIWQNLTPEQKAIAKHMTDDQLRAYIIGQIPAIDAPTVDKAIQIVRRN